MGWKGRDLPSNWKSLRRQVAERAGGTCEAAGCAEPGTECHHAGHRDDHRLDSLQWLCSEHHAVETYQQAAAGRAAMLAKAKYPVRSMPGIL